MITEDYVSYEVAKLLKEKEFDEYCWKFYELGDCGIPVLLNGFDLNEESNFWNNKYLELYKKEHCHINDICSAPTHQMAMKWLREVHNIDIFPWKIGKGIYSCAIFNSNTGQDLSKDKDFPSEKYEECVETVIKYCLEHLI